MIELRIKVEEEDSVVKTYSSLCMASDHVKNFLSNTSVNTALKPKPRLRTVTFCTCTCDVLYCDVKAFHKLSQKQPSRVHCMSQARRCDYNKMLVSVFMELFDISSNLHSVRTNVHADISK